MAGKRQHYIPQFLLTGFASRSRGKETFVWVHKKDGTAFEANTKNVALEKYFYGSATDTSLDDEITSLEGDFAQVLNQARSAPHGSNISGGGIEEFVTNMSVRHKYLRFGMIDSFNSLLDEMERFYSVPVNGEVFTRNYLLKNPQALDKALDEALARLPYSAGQKMIVRRQILAMPKADLVNIAATFFEDALADFKVDVFPQMRANLSDIIKESHIKGLARSLVSAPRLSALKNLRWSVHDIEEPLILGDVCVLFDVDGYDSWLPLAGAADRVKSVYLPIGANRIVVGSGDDAPVILSSVELNQKFSSQSMEFFISHQNGLEEADLRKSISSNSRFFSDKQIKEIVEESIFAD